MTHRSRIGWADAMQEDPPTPPAHTHRLPRVVRLAIVGLTAAVFLLLIATGLLATYVYQQQQYIAGKGVQRDRENQQLNQRVTDRICELLGMAPEDDPKADYYRGQLHCPQPGVAAGEVPPALRSQPTFPVAPAPAPSPRAPAPLPAVPSAPRQGPGPGGPETPAPASPAPTSSPPLLRPLTEPVCDLAGVCF